MPRAGQRFKGVRICFYFLFYFVVFLLLFIRPVFCFLYIFFPISFACTFLFYVYQIFHLSHLTHIYSLFSSFYFFASVSFSSSYFSIFLMATLLPIFSSHIFFFFLIFPCRPSSLLPVLPFLLLFSFSPLLTLAPILAACSSAFHSFLFNKNQAAYFPSLIIINRHVTFPMTLLHCRPLFPLVYPAVLTLLELLECFVVGLARLFRRQRNRGKVSQIRQSLPRPAYGVFNDGERPGTVYVVPYSDGAGREASLR